MRRSFTLIALLLGAASMGGSCHRVKVERWPAHLVRDAACPYPKARGRLVLVQRTESTYDTTQYSRAISVRLCGLPAHRSFVVELEGAEEIGWDPPTATTGAKGSARVRNWLGYGASPEGRLLTVRETAGPALLVGTMPAMTKKGDARAEDGDEPTPEGEEGEAGAEVVLSRNPRWTVGYPSFGIPGLPPSSLPR